MPESGEPVKLPKQRVKPLSEKRSIFSATRVSCRMLATAVVAVAALVIGASHAATSPCMTALCQAW